MLFNLTSLTVGEVTVKDKDDVSITVSAVSEVKIVFVPLQLQRQTIRLKLLTK